MHVKFWTALSGAAIVLAAGAYASYSDEFSIERAWGASETAAPVQPVVKRVMTAKVQYGKAIVDQSLPAIIAPHTASSLAFRVTGKMLKRLVNLGESVRKGDVIARLDDLDFRLKRDAAAAELAAAKMALQKSKENFGRVKKLKSKGFASNRASDDVVVAVEEARSRFLRAQRNLTLAENQLAYTTLRAEASGVVTAELVEAGQVVSAGQSVVEIAHDGPREAVVAIPEGMIANLKSKDATIRLWSRENKRIIAKLRELSPIADRTTRTFEARYVLYDPYNYARLGMSATVHLQQPAGRVTAQLPLSALHYRPDGPIVWRIDAGGRLEPRPVTISSLGFGSAQISGGVSDGDRIVTMGAHRLTRGDLVRPIKKGG